MSFYKGTPAIDFTKIFDDVRKTLDQNRQRKREDRRTEMIEDEFKDRSTDRSRRRDIQEEDRRRRREVFEAGADKRTLEKQRDKALFHWNNRNVKKAREFSPTLVDELERKEIIARSRVKSIENASLLQGLAIKAKNNDAALKQLQLRDKAMLSNLITRKSDIVNALEGVGLYGTQTIPGGGQISLADQWRQSNDVQGFERDLAQRVKQMETPSPALLDLIELFQMESKSYFDTRGKIQESLSGVPVVQSISIPASHPRSGEEVDKSRRTIGYLDKMMADKTDLGLGFRETVKGLSSAFGVNDRVIIDRVRKYEGGGPLPFGKNIKKNASFLYLVEVLRKFAEDEPEDKEPVTIPEPTSLGLFPSGPVPNESQFP